MRDKNIGTKTGSNIRVGSPGNFEAELRLPRQN